jgi:hypothetical protein
MAAKKITPQRRQRQNSTTLQTAPAAGRFQQKKSKHLLAGIGNKENLQWKRF